MDWRILIAVVVLSWGGYNILLKMVGGRLAWQLSMFLFVLSYAVVVAGYCLLTSKLSIGEVFQKPAMWSLGAGILCGVGAIAFFKVIPRVPGSILLPLIGLYTLVSAVGCLLIFREPLTVRIALGIVCATAAVALLST